MIPAVVQRVHLLYGIKKLNNMILNEIGSPVGFEFKKILHKSQKLKSDDYPDSIFYFNKYYCGECNFRIDIDKEIICVSILILDHFQERFKVDPQVVMESIDEVVDQEYENFQVVAMSDWDVDHYDTEYKNDKFIEA